MTIVEGLSKDRLLTLSPKDLFHAVENTDRKVVRTEYIPISKIVVEGTPIDESHARDLGNLLTGEWGQTQSIMLRIRVEGDTDNDIFYDIMDGYHRVAGLGLVADEPNPNIKSEVYYNCSDVELYDQRIIAANSVKAVQFARLGYWMKGAWLQTPWRNKLTVTQAFSLASNQSSGKILGLSLEESAQIRDWAVAKAEKWLIPISTVTHNLKTIEISDEILVSRVRVGSFGKGQLAITPSQLETISTAFPKQGEIQRLIAAHANSHGLSNMKIQILTNHLQGLSLEEVKLALETENWDSVFAGHSELASGTNGNGKRKIVVSKPELRDEVAFLNQKLDDANQDIAQLRKLLKEAQSSEWWSGVTDLSDVERNILRYVFIENISTFEIANRFHIQETRVTQTLWNAIRKYQIYKEDLPFNSPINGSW